MTHVTRDQMDDVYEEFSNKANGKEVLTELMMAEEIVRLRERLAATEIGRSIETFTAAEHIKALEAMGAKLEDRVILMEYRTSPPKPFHHVLYAPKEGERILILPPEMRDD